MIFFLIDWLTALGIKVPQVFLYSSTRMLLAALTALLCTILVGPAFIRKLYALKTGQSIRVEDCPLLVELHKKKKQTPTMGGVLILFSMLLCLVLWMDLKHSFTLLLCLTTVFLGIVGGIDDYLKLKYKNSKGLSGKKKLLIQVSLAALIAAYVLVPWVTQSLQIGSWFAPPEAKEFVSQVTSNDAIQGGGSVETLTSQHYFGRYYFPFVKDPLFILSGAGLIFAFFFTLFVIVGSSNAVNLTDGLDGLAAGCLLMVAVVFALIAFLSNNLELSRYLHILYIEGSSEIAVYLSALIGACLGFLWYNGYPAQVFMGDTGSLSLGGVIGVSAVLLRREFLLAIVGGIFVIEALSVILQVGSYKLRNKKRIFLCSPLHHHFEYKGWPETKVVLRFWIISLIFAIIGIASLKFQ
jgi:phospho-N-acetylmuramoyl-pentapeptide-transferase